MEKYGVNWEKVKARHTAFWKGELEGSALATVTSPKDGTTWRHFPYPESTEDRIKWWTDPELIIRRYRDGMQGQYFAGDSFPLLINDIGPAGHAGFFKGAVPRFEGSIWFEHTLKDYDDLVFDPESFLYRKNVEMAKAYAEDANGDYIIGMPDAVGAGDVLSHLRGADTLMMDFYDEPEAVHKALRTVQGVWENIVDKVHDAVKVNNDGGGCVGWLSTWAPGKHVQLQCDLSVMMSPDMFEEFLMYELEAQSQFADYSLYHLDGEQQVRFLPQLLSVKGIQAIQWTNVAGQKAVTEYIPVLKQIQAAGKGLILHCSPEEIPVLLDNLDARLMHLATWAKNQVEADDIVKMIEKGSR